MKPPDQKLFKVEEYEDGETWFHRFLGKLNRMTEPTVNALSKNLTFGDNISSTAGTFTLITRLEPTENTQEIALSFQKPVQKIWLNTWEFDNPKNPVLGFDYFAYQDGAIVKVAAMEWPVEFIGKKMSVDYLIVYK